jgi:AmmeMemoRadiSam system protein A
MYQHQPSILTQGEGKELLSIARNTLEKFVRSERTVKPEKYPIKLNEKYGVFCTLLKDGEVRGRAAVGLPYPLLSLIDAAMQAVISASHEDLRFTRVTADELASVKIELSILTEPQKIDAMHDSKILSSIIPGTDGLVLSFGMYESFLMPQAWQAIQEKEKFLGTLCAQAGMDEEAWHDAEIQLYKFQAQVFREG